MEFRAQKRKHEDADYDQHNRFHAAARKTPRVKPLRLILIVANTAAIAILLAIPIGKLFGAVEQLVDTAAVFGWIIFFVPLLASALALWGIQFSRAALTRSAVIVGMPGSFLAAFLSLFTYWKGPSDFAQIGVGATILFGLNVLALWKSFIDRLESQNPE
jgi:hypothetical protein